jgi:hypothetical protein
MLNNWSIRTEMPSIPATDPLRNTFSVYAEIEDSTTAVKQTRRAGRAENGLMHRTRLCIAQASGSHVYKCAVNVTGSRKTIHNNRPI